MVSNGNWFSESQESGRPTKSIISQQLFILDNKTGYQIKS